jgi:hypothetical protein
MLRAGPDRQQRDLVINPVEMGERGFKLGEPLEQPPPVVGGLAVDPIHVRQDGLLEDWGCDPPSPQGARCNCTVTLVLPRSAGR